MKKVSLITCAIFLVTAMFGQFSASAATVKNVKKANYYKTASIKKKAGTCKKEGKLTVKKYSKGFVSFSSGKKTYYIKISQVKFSGECNGTIVKTTKLYDLELKDIKKTVGKNSVVVISGIKNKGGKTYFKVNTNYINALDVKIDSFLTPVGKIAPTHVPTPTSTPVPTPTSTPVPTPTSTPTPILRPTPTPTSTPVPTPTQKIIFDYLESSHNYSNDMDKTWDFSLSDSSIKGLLVTFDDQTNVEDGFDYISIKDKDGNEIPGSPFTGSELANKIIGIVGNGFSINLVSDELGTDYGFKVTNVQIATKTCKVSFNSNANVQIPDITAVAGSDLFVNYPIYYDESLFFNGWYSDSELNDPIDLRGYKVTGDKVIYVDWYDFSEPTPTAIPTATQRITSTPGPTAGPTINPAFLGVNMVSDPGFDRTNYTATSSYSSYDFIKALDTAIKVAPGDVSTNKSYWLSETTFNGKNTGGTAPSEYNGYFHFNWTGMKVNTKYVVEFDYYSESDNYFSASVVSGASPNYVFGTTEYSQQANNLLIRTTDSWKHFYAEITTTSSALLLGLGMYPPLADRNMGVYLDNFSIRPYVGEQTPSPTVGPSATPDLNWIVQPVLPFDGSFETLSIGDKAGASFSPPINGTVIAGGPNGSTMCYQVGNSSSFYSVIGWQPTAAQYALSPNARYRVSVDVKGDVNLFDMLQSGSTATDGNAVKIFKETTLTTYYSWTHLSAEFTTGATVPLTSGCQYIIRTQSGMNPLLFDNLVIEKYIGNNATPSPALTPTATPMPTRTATPTSTPTPILTATPIPTPTPSPTPTATPTDIPGRATSNPDTANIFKNYSFTEIRTTIINGGPTQYPCVVPIVQGDVEFTDEQLNLFQGSLSPWNFNYGSGGGKYMTISEDAKRNGKYGIKFDPGYSGGHMKFLGLKNNEDYVFSFWIKKAAEGNFNIYACIIGVNSGKNGGSPDLKISNAINEWTQYKIRFNTGAATGGEVLIQYDNTSPDTVYLDDMMMYPYYEQLS